MDTNVFVGRSLNKFTHEISECICLLGYLSNDTGVHVFAVRKLSKATTENKLITLGASFEDIPGRTPIMIYITKTLGTAKPMCITVTAPDTFTESVYDGTLVCRDRELPGDFSNERGWLPPLKCKHSLRKIIKDWCNGSVEFATPVVPSTSCNVITHTAIKATVDSVSNLFDLV